MAIDKNSKTVTPVFRVSYPAVFSPKKPMGAPAPDKEPKYGLMAIWTPSTFDDGEKKLWANMMRILNEASMARFQKALKDLPPNYKRGLRRGDEKESLTKDQVFANITSLYKPQIKAADGKSDITDAARFYAGCYARAVVNAFSFGGPQSNGGYGVALGMQSLMFVKDGERLDNRTDAAEDFAEYASPEIAAAFDEDLGF